MLVDWSAVSVWLEPRLIVPVAPTGGVVHENGGAVGRQGGQGVGHGIVAFLATGHHREGRTHQLRQPVGWSHRLGGGQRNDGVRYLGMGLERLEGPVQHRHADYFAELLCDDAAYPGTAPGGHDDDSHVTRQAHLPVDPVVPDPLP